MLFLFHLEKVNETVISRLCQINDKRKNVFAVR